MHRSGGTGPLSPRTRRHRQCSARQRGPAHQLPCGGQYDHDCWRRRSVEIYGDYIGPNGILVAQERIIFIGSRIRALKPEHIVTVHSHEVPKTLRVCRLRCVPAGRRRRHYTKGRDELEGMREAWSRNLGSFWLGTIRAAAAMPPDYSMGGSSCLARLG